MSLQEFDLKGCLGYNRHNQKAPYVNNIKVRTNTKMNGKYVVGGSTYVLATINVGKVIDKKWHSEFHHYWQDNQKETGNDESEFLVKEEYRAHFIVYGHLQSRSPLLHWNLLCEYRGFIASESQMKEDASLRPMTTSLLRELDINRRQKFSLLKSNDKAFVFQIKHVKCEPEKLSWSGKRISGGNSNGKYKGDNLKRLGLMKRENSSVLNQRDYQILRFQVAEMGVEDEDGESQLHKLNNRKLKHMLRTRRKARSGFRTYEFPGYSFYGNAILEAARYHSKSNLWCKVVHLFLPSYGQYLRDSRLLLVRLQKAFDAVQNGGLEFLDTVFYGTFNDCFRKIPRLDQIKDTLMHWEMYRPTFAERIIGWQSRFDLFSKVYDHRQQFGNTAFTLYDMKKIIGQVEPQGMRYYTTLNNDKQYCFDDDWKMYEFFATHALKHKFYYGFGLPTEVEENAVFLYPSLAVKRFYNANHVKQMVFEVPYQYYVTTFHIRDAKELCQKLQRMVQQHKKLVLVGLEYWAIDKVCFLLNYFAYCKFHFQYFQFDNIEATVRANARLSPTFDSLIEYDKFEFTELLKYDNDINELEPDENELKVYMNAKLSMSNGPVLNRFGFKNGVQIVCFHREEYKEALLEYPRSYLRQDLKDEENLNTHFFLGDRVITPCGFIDHINHITYNGEIKKSIGMEVYTGCGIYLKNFPERIFHATELKLAYILMHSAITAPVPKVMLYGSFPDYVRVQYETYLCTEEFIKHPNYKSKDTLLNEKYERQYTLEKFRPNPLSGVLYELQKKQKEEEDNLLKDLGKRKREEKHEKMRQYIAMKRQAIEAEKNGEREIVG